MKATQLQTDYVFVPNLLFEPEYVVALLLSPPSQCKSVPARHYVHELVRLHFVFLPSCGVVLLILLILLF
jgi:hypothetical protein